jgi:hypothetical protein
MSIQFTPDIPNDVNGASVDNDETLVTGRFDDLFDDRIDMGPSKIFGKYEPIVIGWMDFIDGSDDSVDGGIGSDSDNDSDNDSDVIHTKPDISNFIHVEFDRSSDTHGIYAERRPSQHENSNQSALTDFENSSKEKSALTDFLKLDVY